MNSSNKVIESLQPVTYRRLLVDEGTGGITARFWNDAIREEESPWERLDIVDQRFVLRADTEVIALSSISRENLPPSFPRSRLGQLLVDRVHLGKILSSRPGTEEVTFYAMLGRPHGRNGFEKRLDRFFLSIAAPPLIWRRKKVVQELRRFTFNAMSKGPMIFFDIGSGGGFDGIDLHRILSSAVRRSHESDTPLPLPRYRIVNVDIDTAWLGYNEAICRSLFPHPGPFHRRNISIFDYLDKEEYRKDIENASTCIVSCNGFADFYGESEFTTLLAGIRALAETCGEMFHLVLPCSMKNRKQESLSNAVGFNYIAKPKERLDSLVNAAFPDFLIESETAHNQVVYSIAGRIKHHRQ